MNKRNIRYLMLEKEDSPTKEFHFKIIYKVGPWHIPTQKESDIMTYISVAKHFIMLKFFEVE
jgi:hypothetical protein